MKDDDDTMCYRSELEAEVKAEREACAQLCERMWHEWLDSTEDSDKPDAEDCYRAIRARGNT
jgi:hypothetical protein